MHAVANIHYAADVQMLKSYAPTRGGETFAMVCVHGIFLQK